ncbi:hypothetical protein A1Q1_02678 [Trichosporon asahii var. asahii CBS 2479]|uniref:Uncharacterized protein n=1 Tax=Trichosporon asahii var. asahii (strain ATCC 90039 / CBS 2479 / JCM 2466 / KCTC 7840 / NBRC 103889/ NCYC 2677 / UAMH 7654) TaxID=1186058 RepID=J4UBW3_TRIAS|nr:hypothetical protein A1Q1_02678 [Trichosporon asahii var. asahii CBS 2479]EJT48395.1 hypothetical protein A1Q1_02678 [Trichosporon asahii var. asahii CBS 2479]
MFAQALTLAALAGAVAAQSGLKINTPPALTLCEPSLITWEGGEAPYIVSVIPGGQQSAPALKYLSQGTNDHQMTWNIDIEAGTQVTLKVLDKTGLAAFSAPVSGTDRSCLSGGSASASASASDAPASESGSASEAPASETPSESAAPSPSSAEASPSASAAPSPSAAPSSAASPSAPVSSATASPSAGSSTSSRAPTSTTSKAAASPSASVNSGAKANVASFGIIAAAGALVALF